MLLMLLMVKKLLVHIGTSQEEFRIEKVLKKKGNKLYVKWKGYNNYFNSWIDKKKHCIKLFNIFQSLMNHLLQI